MRGRHVRQTPILGSEGQERLAGSSIAVIGCGGLGCSAITHLAAAGVGKLVLVDMDSPSESDLNRQFVYAGQRPAPKAVLAAEWARRVGGGTDAVPLHEELTEENADRVLRGCDMAIDCLDNNRSRFVLNAAALRAGMPLIHGAVDGANGQVTVVVPGRTACLECFLPGGPAAGPVPSVGSVVSVVGGIEATEAIKMITGRGRPLAGRLLALDAFSWGFTVTDLRARPGCARCSDAGSLHESA